MQQIMLGLILSTLAAGASGACKWVYVDGVAHNVCDYSQQKENSSLNDAFMNIGKDVGAGVLLEGAKNRQRAEQDRLARQDELDRRNAAAVQYQADAATDHARFWIGQVLNAKTEQQAEALWDYGQDDALARGYIDKKKPWAQVKNMYATPNEN